MLDWWFDLNEYKGILPVCMVWNIEIKYNGAILSKMQWNAYIRKIVGKSMLNKKILSKVTIWGK